MLLVILGMTGLGRTIVVGADCLAVPESLRLSRITKTDPAKVCGNIPFIIKKCQPNIIRSFALVLHLVAFWQRNLWGRSRPSLLHSALTFS